MRVVKRKCILLSTATARSHLLRSGTLYFKSRIIMRRLRGKGESKVQLCRSIEGEKKNNWIEFSINMIKLNSKQLPHISGCFV